MKLTRPQFCLLCDLREGPRFIYEDYRPRKALEASGLAEFSKGKLRITQAGKDLLANMQPGQIPT